jgi:hypothetical protein
MSIKKRGILKHTRLRRAIAVLGFIMGMFRAGVSIVAIGRTRSSSAKAPRKSPMGRITANAAPRALRTPNIDPYTPIVPSRN